MSGVDGVSIWVGTWREDLGFGYMKATPCRLIGWMVVYDGWALALCLALCLVSNRATTPKNERSGGGGLAEGVRVVFSVILGIHP